MSASGLLTLWVLSFTSFTGHVYCDPSSNTVYTYFSYNKVTWNKANEICSQHGMKLAGDTSEEVFETLEQLIGTGRAAVRWVGLYCVNGTTEGLFWTGCKPATDLKMTGLKLDRTSNPQCVRGKISLKRDWNTESCSKAHHVICEQLEGTCSFELLENTMAVNLPTMTLNTDVNCQDLCLRTMNGTDECWAYSLNHTTSICTLFLSSTPIVLTSAQASDHGSSLYVKTCSRVFVNNTDLGTDTYTGLSEPLVNCSQPLGILSDTGSETAVTSPVPVSIPTESETDIPKDHIPDTDIPKPDVPETEVPKTDVPETKARKTDVPKTEVPKSEAPKTDVTETEVPKTEVPETEVPKTEAPKTDVNKTESPKTGIPKTDIPKTDIPKTDVPETDILETDIPETDGEGDSSENLTLTETSTAASLTILTWSSKLNYSTKPLTDDEIGTADYQRTTQYSLSTRAATGQDYTSVSTLTSVPAMVHLNNGVENENTCRCVCRLNYSLEEKKLFTKTIVKNLTVDKANVSSFRRRLISVPDERVSATSIGLAGCILIIVPVAIVILLDTSTLLTHLTALCP